MPDVPLQAWKPDFKLYNEPLKRAVMGGSVQAHRLGSSHVGRSSCWVARTGLAASPILPEGVHIPEMYGLRLRNFTTLWALSDTMLPIWTPVSCGIAVVPA